MRSWRWRHHPSPPTSLPTSSTNALQRGITVWVCPIASGHMTGPCPCMTGNLRCQPWDRQPGARRQVEGIPGPVPPLLLWLGHIHHIRLGQPLHPASYGVDNPVRLPGAHDGAFWLVQGGVLGSGEPGRSLRGSHVAPGGMVDRPLRLRPGSCGGGSDSRRMRLGVILDNPDVGLLRPLRARSDVLC